MQIKLIYDIDPQEYVLIEFQGDLENDSEESLQCVPIGSLEQTEDNKIFFNQRPTPILERALKKAKKY
ncbi:hypothetical protein IMG5_078990 [Ichthyophthirius multifiliis]|uniref:Uncharacterized protein n=1 Tax=Ichthyophthirius multifiliis TaxID=5932 RepID=G0QQH1_ICHMU|nr:hypothetical protein IMG5_078990 [Ichthyophthirius multifiliis]EGR32529.1 hypothetical protein IMG5_078990 [Ichthyophthirius multifiliis]|eukprot:XP_004036515.1 hypothetical protein IMG5_078990 [Ichthyophthirius multifiliis]